MSLKEICSNNLINMIKNLPPVLKEELLGKSQKEIESEERLKVIKEMTYYLPCIIENMVSERIKEIDGNNYKEYPEMSQDIFNICEETTTNIMRLIENKVMNNTMDNYRMINDSDDSSD